MNNFQQMLNQAKMAQKKHEQFKKEEFKFSKQGDLIKIIVSGSYKVDLKINFQHYQSLTLAFLDLFATTLKLQQEKDLATIEKWFNIYYTIAQKCDFTKDDIFNAYLAKNKINHLRQEQNY